MKETIIEKLESLPEEIKETFDGKDLPEKEYAVLSIRRYDLS